MWIRLKTSVVRIRMLRALLFTLALTSGLLLGVEASFATGPPIPTDYSLWALVYCVLYSTVAMLLALTLFEDRDLA